MSSDACVEQSESTLAGNTEACALHMYGIMKGGEVAGVQFFIDYARGLSHQMAAQPLGAPQVRVGKVSLRLASTLSLPVHLSSGNF